MRLHDTWWYLTILTIFGKNLQHPTNILNNVNTWPYLDNVRRYLASTWQYEVMPNKLDKKMNNVSFWEQLGHSFLAISDNTLWYLSIPDITFTVLNNTYQLLTIPDKPCISWDHLVLTKYQVLLPIQFQYHENIIIWFWQFFVFLVSSQYRLCQFLQNFWELVLIGWCFEIHSEKCKTKNWLVTLAPELPSPKFQPTR